MVYQISGNTAGQGDVDSDATVRDYWAISYQGAYLANFEAGFTIGTQDLATDSKAGHMAMMLTEASLRDTAWNAQLDGYNYATRSRGTNDEAPGFTERFVQAEPIVVKSRRRKRTGPFGNFRC